MEDDALTQVPGEVLTSSNGQWREKVFGSFAFSTASVMGTQTEHHHPVEPRHVRRFVEDVQNVVARGDLRAEQGH
jgi:hypothetical protein